MFHVSPPHGALKCSGKCSALIDYTEHSLLSLIKDLPRCSACSALAGPIAIERTRSTGEGYLQSIAFFISLSRTVEQKERNPAATMVSWCSPCADPCRTLPNIVTLHLSPAPPNLRLIAYCQLLEIAKDGAAYSSLASSARSEAL
jgi:hypothetical protein